MATQTPPPAAQAETTAQSPPPAARAETNEPEDAVAPPQDEYLEADDGEDSAYGDSNSASDFTSVSSSVYKGVIQNGRRYQSLKEGEYWGPSDEQQFESMASTHLTFLLVDQFQENQYFRSPIGEGVKNVLDIGTGEGQWAMDVADKYPNLTVYGVDLFPPPQDWVAPNCILEVDDVTKPWMWKQQFDLVHIRWMFGAFTEDEWDSIYRKAYKNLKPGGWIEHAEISIAFECDDGTLPADSIMTRWYDIFAKCVAKMGKRVDTLDTMREKIERAGFTNVQEASNKFPVGPWPKNPVYKEVGRVHLNALKTGLEGYTMFLLTNFGDPEPWSPEQVQLFLMETRQEFNNKTYHAYERIKRVWAQKPLEEKTE